MLDEKEFATVAQLYSECIHGAKTMRLKNDSQLNETPVSAQFRSVREAYFQMTGMDESNENASCITAFHCMAQLVSIAANRCERREQVSVRLVGKSREGSRR